MSGASLTVAAFAAALGASMSVADAETVAEPNKVIAFVDASGCNIERLRPVLGDAASRAVQNPGSIRVVINWPADPERNLDLMGRPSPFVAALEVSADTRSLGRIARRIERQIRRTCPIDTYLVREQRFLTQTRIWQLGEPSPDIKVLTTLVRKEGLSRDEFQSEWSGPHSEMALSWRRDQSDQNGRYVQNLVMGRIGKDTPAIDGIGEGGGPGAVSDAQRAARMKTAEHTRMFMDVAATRMFLAQEVILKD